MKKIIIGQYRSIQTRENRFLILLKTILPLMISVILLKLLILFVDYRYFRIPILDLGELLTIIGIVIGIILGLGVGFAVSKYKEANDNLDNTRAILWTLGDLILRRKVPENKKKKFIKSCRVWLETYRGYLKDRRPKSEMIRRFREFSMHFRIFEDRKRFSSHETAQIETWRCDMQKFMSGEDSLKSIRTPPAYYQFLLVAIFLYIFSGLFVYPGFVGLIWGSMAVFFFGGMYTLAVDFDNPFGHGAGEIVDVDIDTPISDGQKYIDDDY